MARQVYDKQTGRFVWVNDDGSVTGPQNDPMGVNPGLGSLPGRALARERDLASRLPDAQLAGYRGPSVVDPTPSRGARPNDPEPAPVPTYRPLAGAKQNSRGNARLVALPYAASPPAPPLSTIEVGSIVETSRQSGDDAENIRIICSYDVNLYSGPISIQGYAEFGVGGASFAVDFDWLQGTSFAIPASFVRIGASLLYQSSSAVAGSQIVLSAGLAYGGPPFGHFSPLRKTDVIGTLPGATLSNSFDIPAFASSATLMCDTSSAPNLRLYFYGGTGQSVSFDYVSRTNANFQMDGQFPIPGWAKSYAVQNLSAAPATAGNVTAVFSLAL